MSAPVLGNLSDDQADGLACIVCCKQGRAEEGQIVGTGDTGTPVWACPGGCVLIAGWHR